MLEYYSGILFLTTNRVGILDEAFKSRIHISLYYERLTLKRTLAIFEVNIRKLREIEKEKQEQLEDSDLKELTLEVDDASIMDFAERHFRETPETVRWNGRQIRNAFQIASSLARYDMYSNKSEGPERVKKRSDTFKDGEAPNLKPVLDKKQFQLVSETIARFDAYFFLATGERDEDAARREMIRDDGVRHGDLIQHQQQYDTPTPPVKSRGSKGTTSRGQGSYEKGYDDDDRGPRSSRRTGNQSSSRRDVQPERNSKTLAQRPRHKSTGGKYASEDDDDDDDDDYSDEEQGAAPLREKEGDGRQKGKSQSYRGGRHDEDDEDDEDRSEEDD